jgi:hypothetical protein
MSPNEGNWSQWPDLVAGDRRTRIGFTFVRLWLSHRFFLKTKIGGKDYYVPNYRFGYRFFPPALARIPMSQRMLVKKPANTYRIFVFGESVAMGDPDPTFGVCAATRRFVAAVRSWPSNR